MNFRAQVEDHRLADPVCLNSRPIYGTNGAAEFLRPKSHRREMSMTATSNPAIRVGSIDVIPIWDGPLPTTLDKILDPAHRREAEELLAAAPADALTMNVYCFLLRLGDAWALIDAGGGPLMSAELGMMRNALGKHGVRPEDVRHIFMTHVHRDHYGGLVTPEGKAFFPNADIIVVDQEISFWLDRRIEDMPKKALRHLEQQRMVMGAYQGRIRRVADKENVLGLTPHIAAGHSPGHTCWLVESQGQKLLAWGDIIHIAYLHLPAPHIAFDYDLDAAAAMTSRVRILDWVSRDNIPVAGAHLPGSGIATIVRQGSGFSFKSR